MTTLYKTNKNGSIQQWSVETNGATITCTFGQVGGKMQTKDTIAKPKNIGKANETTPEQQALIEAAALVEKKKKSGYSTDKSAPVVVELPMKVKSYKDVWKNVVFPCIASPKLNGVNALFKLKDGGLTRYSRGGLVQPELVHLTEFIISELNRLETTSLNAELYKHGAYLEDIDSASKKINDFSKELELHVFELPDVNLTYEAKHIILESSNFNTPENVILNSHEEIEAYHKKCVELGYEGIVIRNKRAKYAYNERSSDVFKKKYALDDEFKIVSMDIDKNGHPVFHLESNREDKKTFKAKPKGTAEQKLKIIAEYESKYLGSWYKVEYESISKYGIPAKPIGIALRDCDENGEPLV